MTDPAEIRAEGRRLLAALRLSEKHGSGVIPNKDRLAGYLVANADVLLADPAPVGLSEARRWIQEATSALAAASIIGMRSCRPGDGLHYANHDRLINEADAIIDRLSAAPVDDREPSVTYTSTATRRTTSVDDDRERIPEGWQVEWACGEDCFPGHVGPHPPRLVPVSPSVDPEEG